MEHLNLDHQIETIKLEVTKMCTKHIINTRYLPHKVKVGAYLDRLSRDLIITAECSIASQRLDAFTVKYPENWIEAIKERWAPRWLLNKYPIKYHQKIYEVKAYYPKLAIPDEQHYVLLHKLQGGLLDGQELVHSSR